ncbi:fat body protein 2-like [Teleopsis dalmanni]|uniref:fat body protein 2-like n=1 Tax=Teleopsis dalmanni TaxID=139649 RepID=UPI0018CDBBDA|nr:fat body protein 2-like [Teleopsis dalmanni]XP_037938242.1 fat body protein 2-like [Teleopsis dalmanni]
MAFRGKNIVITGGASGIGLQVCKQMLASEVAKIAIIDLQDNMEEVVKMRSSYPAQSVVLIKMDVSNKKGMDATYAEIIKSLGSLDIVVNVAGIFNDKDVQKTLMTNLGGMINSTLAAMKYMSKENGGNGGIIMNMSSVVGLDPMFLIPVYASTKAGIIHFTRCFGNDMYLQRTGIKFITVCPGATITDMFTNFTEKILYSDMGDESYRVLDRLNKQSVTDVGRCMLSALEKEENGAVYIIEGKRLFPMEMTSYWRGIEKELNE